jgi:DUF4097 and DUF4098 domain-containing protein YvlB
MWKLLTCALLLTPSLAHAADECKFQAPRNAALNLAGVRTLVIGLGQHTLHLNGTPGSTAQLSGRACASSQDRLNELRVTQRREGDRLILTAESVSSNWSFSLFGASHYAYLDLHVNVPANLPVELAVGSGDADVVGVARLSGHTGSGDLHVHGISGRFDAQVGSGDIEANGVGEIHVASVGSGDFKASDVHGDVQIGSIGSGSADLTKVGGNVVVDTIGSGDLSVDGVAHDLHVRKVGSGDVSHNAVAGRVDIPRED